MIKSKSNPSRPVFPAYSRNNSGVVHLVRVENGKTFCGKGAEFYEEIHAPAGEAMQWGCICKTCYKAAY